MPQFITEKLEILMNKATKYIVNRDRTKLIVVHRDRFLYQIQSLLTPKIFTLFYRNYIDSFKVRWSCNQK